MNNVVNVYHKSKDIIYSFDFTAGGENSWSFTTESDGEIYSEDKSNINNYTINGSSVSLPFNISAGNSYTISIDRTNQNSSAELKLYCRRNEEKTVSATVPNFSDYPATGYLYVLLSNSVKIYDVSLLTASNYAGSGSWTTSPLYATVSLPTTYNNVAITWYVINYDDGDMICWGSTYGNESPHTHVLCRIKNDLTVWDYYETTQNSVTVLPYRSTFIYYPRAVITDFVGGNYVVHFNCYGQQPNALVKIDKTDLTVTSSNFYVSGNIYKLTYNPFKRQIVYYGDIDIETFRYKNFLFANNVTTLSGYSFYLNKSMKANANSYGSLKIYDEYGKIFSTFKSSGTGPGGNGNPGSLVVNQSNNIVLSVSINQSSFALFDLVNAVGTNYRLNSFTETNLGVRHLSTDERSKKFFFTTTSNHANKVLIIDANNEAEPEIGYIEESEDIQCIANNNYI